jgi:hypothetical protein
MQMRTQTIVLTALLACGAASAQQKLTTVEVRADTLESVDVACASPGSVSNKDVERVLAVTDPAKAAGLRKKFVAAATEACKAGIPKILVSRSATGGSLTWKRMD